jgi:hypothetical protein
VAVFSIRDGQAALKAQHSTGAIYFAIVLGVVLHFVWEILVAAVRAQESPDFGSWGLIGARVGIGLIVGIVSFTGVYKQLDGVDPRVRFFFAATQGFAADALANPIGPATTN